MDNEFKLFLAELMLKKYGREKLIKLLTDEFCIDVNIEKLKSGRRAYIRDLKDEKTPFSEPYKKDQNNEIPADLVLQALEDAANHMNYSNWHTDKFDRAAECVIRYCEEHEILITFKARDG